MSDNAGSLPSAGGSASVLIGGIRVRLDAVLGVALSPDATARATPRARRQPVRLPPPVDGLLDREAETAAALEALRAGMPVELHGECGAGKTSVLRELARQALAGPDATGVVYVRPGQGLEDLLQLLFELLYETGGPRKATREELWELLPRSRATVLVDDFALGREELEELLSALRGCRVVLASTRPVLAGVGRSVAVLGLPAEAAVELVRRELGRDMTGQERLDAEQLCRTLNGHPLRLLQATALVREHGRGFRELDLALTGPHAARRLEQARADALPGSQRQVLALLAFAGGALLPSSLIEAITTVTDARELLDSLRGQGLVEERDGWFGLPSCQVAEYRRLLHRWFDLGQAVRTLTDWLEHPGEPLDPLQLGDAALSLIEACFDAGQWEPLLRLSRALEPFLVVAGRWLAWEHVIERGTAAARELHDIAAQAYFQHQHGSRALAQGDTATARDSLDQALALRERSGDEPGVARTRRNLLLLQQPAPPPPPEPSQPSQPRRSWRERSRLGVRVSSVAGLALTLVLWGVNALPKQRPHPPLAGTTTSRPAVQSSQSTRPEGTSPSGQVVPGQPSTSSQGGSSTTSSTAAATTTTTTTTMRPAEHATTEPSGLNFGRTDLATSSDAQAFTLSNDGGTVLDIQASVSGQDPADFLIDDLGDGCERQVPPGATCTVWVAFSPLAVGGRSAELTFVNAVTGHSWTSQLRGTGIAVLHITVRPDRTELGKVTSKLPALACNSDCVYRFDKPVAVTLQAEPDRDRGAWFTWGDDCSASDSELRTCGLFMDASHPVSIDFVAYLQGAS